MLDDEEKDWRNALLNFISDGVMQRTWDKDGKETLLNADKILESLREKYT